MSIKTRLTEIRDSIPKHVTLVAVSKTKPNSAIIEAYDNGQRIFGENKVQEMVQKWETLPKDIEWHMIGHLQRNKVKYMAHFVSLVHGIDSFRLLQEINKQAEKHNRVIDCLLQVHIAEEETKFGLNQTELHEVISSKEFNELRNIRIVGLMGMATFTNSQAQIKKEFAQLKSIFDKVKNYLPSISVLSMGMSGDYKLAIEAGSTMVRVGSSIFGTRN